MNHQNNSLRYDNPADADTEWGRSSNLSYANFRKEYQRNLIQAFDKRFLIIWLFSFVVHFSLALYFAINPPSTRFEQSDIDRIQKQFATLVLEKKTIAPPVEAAPVATEPLVAETAPRSSYSRDNSRNGPRSGASNDQGTSYSGTVSDQSGDLGSGSNAGSRLASRQAISQEVSSKGLLGLLTGAGSNVKGEAITDVLGEAASQRDLDKTLGNLDGLKKSDQSGGAAIIKKGQGQLTQKGSRTTETGGIDDLLVEKGQLKATDMKRTGNIVLEDVSEVADERGIKSESRHSDEVSEVVNRHNSSIQYCYQRELKQNPDLKGKLVVRFTISPDGTVKDVKIVSSTLNSSSIERCVISRIKRWDDFGAVDASKGDATFRQVYTFGY